ncbi:hypothetical protein K439DRAFT_1618125 [Ramaria rubella]|nr:hypothetical protein K439DRAFT_1618125 [Ramaria rubella]
MALFFSWVQRDSALVLDSGEGAGLVGVNAGLRRHNPTLIEAREHAVLCANHLDSIDYFTPFFHVHHRSLYSFYEMRSLAIVSILTVTTIAFSAPLSTDFHSDVNTSDVQATHFQEHVPRSKTVTPKVIAAASNKGAPKTTVASLQLLKKSKDRKAMVNAMKKEREARNQRASNPSPEPDLLSHLNLDGSNRDIDDDTSTLASRNTLRELFDRELTTYIIRRNVDGSQTVAGLD